MKRNNKIAIIISLSICFLVCVFISVNQIKQTKESLKPIPVQNVLLSYHNIGKSNFYYDQLTAEEKIVFHQIEEKLDHYDGGEFVLQDMISINNLSRICDAIRYSGDKDYAHWVFTFPFSEDNRYLDCSIDQEEELFHKKQVYKLVILLNTNQRLAELEEMLPNKANGYMERYDEFQTIADDVPSDYVAGFKEIENKTEIELEKIIEEMPKNLNQEEVIQYFRQWIVDNMEYDYGQGENVASNNQIVRYASAIISNKNASIINKAGICGGFSKILVDLCRRVGIDAYVAIGSVSDRYGRGMHAWVGVRIGEQVFYADPTKDVGVGEIDHLKSWEQLQSQYRKYLFIDHFEN